MSLLIIWGLSSGPVNGQEVSLYHLSSPRLELTKTNSKQHNGSADCCVGNLVLFQQTYMNGIDEWTLFAESFQGPLLSPVTLITYGLTGKT